MKYEYKTLNFRKRAFFTSAVDVKALDEMLNESAEKGWELVSVNLIGLLAQAAIVVLKRPATSPAMR
ncbi:MAG TPA: DUF4177 domain-containing protein [Gammaproteobacteria bacterium]|nr:DUF4177 domain-containing protein [Gammaproteobacteria bacterium]